ncbi:TPA: DUF2290 domain-containing protein [Streptococcus equi subsp. zooepidemicus]|uniref:DUF2290 domain-containing protein n=1 Tax=Streptococcus equi TaxID=1336 RepID=UPI0013F59C32|nr:DUF2290 domain-containing protein [Streptococcus equi]HEL0027011.1 DUF2290 domain-containing protein [Streptococcus equi subsp. zooepidemicus]HEL0669538.1 DUF2290 domain-containing protein [Streptococcus equi subsp. zooepidemicus]HEL0822101.1 DUF2290 domain-containing protein [Streptococcus equi subsp. zooepidemicus]HEL1331823.1 DUF2290 domain-containing protein [Streptococcus equi subsp. zooepidemicus]
MLVAKDIFLQIKNITSNLIALGLCVDQNFPSIKELTGSIEEINMSIGKSSNNSSIFLKNISYSDMYYELCRLRMFNIKMIDGALIQMQYRFSGDSIERHRLAFFPSPNLDIFQNEPDLYLEDEIYSDILDTRIVTVPLRFDFDDSKDQNGNRVAIPVLHPISHLTIGQYKNCRIPVSSAITPYQFIEFIIRNFYNTAFERYSDKLIGDKSCFDVCIHTDEKKIFNVCSPLY